MHTYYLFLIHLIFGLLSLFCRVKSDSDSIFDYCVADTKNSRKIFFNGVPCINPNDTCASHFATSALSNPDNISPINFNISVTNVDNFPGLNTLGLVMARVDIAASGLVPPHSHPRASELMILLEGLLLVGFVDTSNRLYRQQLSSGDSFIFPKALIHFLFNLDTNKTALVISGLNSQNPGTQMSSFATFTSSHHLSKVNFPGNNSRYMLNMSLRLGGFLEDKICIDDF